MKRRLPLLSLIFLFGAAITVSASELQDNLMSSSPEVRRSAVGEFKGLSSDQKKKIAVAIGKDLSGQDIDRRERAAQALQDLGPDAAPAIGALRAGLSDDFPVFRVQCAQALSNIGTPAIPTFIETLKNDNADVRAIGAMALGKLGSDASSAAPALAQALKDSDATVRGRAATALAQIGPSAAGSVISLARQSTNSGVRLTAVRVLGDMHSTDEALLQTLIGALSDSDAQIRLSAVKALGHKGKEAVPALQQALKSDQAVTRAGAAEVLGDLRRAAGDAVPGLQAALKDSDSKVQAAAATALGKIGPAAQRAIADLRELAKSGNETLAARAKEALTNLTVATGGAKPPANELTAAPEPAPAPAAASETKAVVAPVKKHAPTKPSAKSIAAKAASDNLTRLIRQLGNSDEAARHQAQDALIQMGEKAVPPLEKALIDSKPLIRQGAAETLGKIGAPSEKALAGLTNALVDPVTSVRQKAGASLLVIDSTASVKIFEAVMKSTDVAVSTGAIHFLGELGSSAQPAVVSLTDQLKSSDLDIQDAAAEALEKIGTSDAKNALKTYQNQQQNKEVMALVRTLRKSGSTINREAVAGLIKLGPPAVPRMAQMLRDPNPSVRGGAAMVLHGLSYAASSVVPQLIDALDNSDPTVRHEAAATLERIGTPQATKPLTMYRLKEKIRDWFPWLHL